VTTNYMNKPISTIEGIGKAYARALLDGGLETVGDLLRSSSEEIEVLVEKAGKKRIAGWIGAGRLLRVSGMTPDRAEALIRGGIETLAELSNARLERVEQAFEKAVAEGRMRESLSLYDMAALQQAAWKTRDTGSLEGRLVDRASGKGIPAAEMRAGSKKATTDEQGRFYFAALPEGELWLRYEVAGQDDGAVPLMVEKEMANGPVTIRIEPPAGDQLAPEELHERDGMLVGPGGCSRLELVSCELEALPSPTLLQVRRVEKGSCRLLHLYRRQQGRRVIADRVEVPCERLPAGAKVGDVVEYTDGRFEKTELTLRDVAKRRLDAAVGNMELAELRRFVPVPAYGGA